MYVCITKDFGHKNLPTHQNTTKSLLCIVSYIYIYIYIYIITNKIIIIIIIIRKGGKTSKRTKVPTGKLICPLSRINDSTTSNELVDFCNKHIARFQNGKYIYIYIYTNYSISYNVLYIYISDLILIA